MNIQEISGFAKQELNSSDLELIKNLAKNCRKNILEMTTSAGSGHPGGSLSSIDIYVSLWLEANINPNIINNPERDRIVVSHGHTAAGLYAALANLGYIKKEKVISSFRKASSIFEGHPNIKIPGVEWGSGNLGQGLSVGVGFALGSKLKKLNSQVFVIMGDGEQQKGQTTEARELAAKYKLDNLISIIDVNKFQASGETEIILPQNLKEKYRIAGWDVYEIDGHNYEEIYKTIKICYENKENPSVILADTVMGKGISFMENKYEYHGKVLSPKECKKAILELELNDKENSRQLKIIDNQKKSNKREPPIELKIHYGQSNDYKKEKIACRTAFGKTLNDIGKANPKNKIAVIDCDLAASVRTKRFSDFFPENFLECGIQEHNAASIAGAISKLGILTFFADFGVFGIDEVFGQLRMNDFNETSLKLICTHCGLDVGEDGKTHQCIDYIGMMSNLFGFKIVIPADGNQTDRIIRYVATKQGNFVVMMGRSKIPILTNNNSPLYGGNYKFEYGKADWVRTGKKGTIITYGTMVHKAVRAYQILQQDGIDISILNITCPNKLDYSKIDKAAQTGLIVTYEDHHINTGLGNIIGTYLAEHQIKCKFKRMGITKYGISASADKQYEIQNLDEESLVNVIKNE